MKEVDRQNDARLQIFLTEVIDTIEMLMLSGLTSVSPSITDKFQNAFEQAVKCKQLRLSSNLRLVNQELKRFFDDDVLFSEKRFSLFLNRCWLMSRQIAMSKNNDFTNQLDTSQPVEVVEELKVAIHGVIKKTVPGVFCALEFRLRKLGDFEPHNKPLLWSCLLAIPEKSKITPETLLSLDQPQKFQPVIFLDSIVTLRNIRLSEDDTAIRIQLDQESQVTAEKMTPAMIDNPINWSLEKLVKPLTDWNPTPLDLETQPLYEIYLDNWRIDNEIVHPFLDNKVLFPLYTNNKQLYIVIDNSDDGQGQLDYFRDKLNEKHGNKNNLLFGLLHFEQGISLFQPLTVWQKNQPPKHLMITDDHSDYSALLKILK